MGQVSTKLPPRIFRGLLFTTVVDERHEHEVDHLVDPRTQKPAPLSEGRSSLTRRMDQPSVVSAGYQPASWKFNLGPSVRPSASP